MRFQRLDLNLLVALNALLTERSVSAAAEHIHLTQPAMSHALARLRQHFGDELLIAAGRRAILTPRAQELIEPLRETLMRIDKLISGPVNFNPARSTLRFAIAATDYALAVVVAGAINQMKAVAPHVGFDVVEPTDPLIGFERGEIDLLIMPQQFLLPDHPSMELYDDEFVAVVWSGSPLAAQEISSDQYFDSAHVAVLFPWDVRPDLAQAFTLAPPRSRRIEVTVPAFTALTLIVVGTDLIASMPRRLAELCARTQPLTIKPLPFFSPTMHIGMQWSKLRDGDAAIRWVAAMLRSQIATNAMSSLPAGSISP